MAVSAIKGRSVKVLWQSVIVHLRGLSWHVRLVLTAILVLWLITWIFYRPADLFHDPLSPVLKDNAGQLLSARIAADGQWRFPPPDSIPEKYIRALLAFEDKRFYYHPGFDPLAALRATVSNLRAGKVVSGGSTLTMQLIRLSRKGKARTLTEKLNELWRAIALELTAGKDVILKMYAANAPFGGNVVGLEAASWRWFACAPENLSWAEAATLAILPNAPSMISLQRNRDAFLLKRNALIKKLFEKAEIDQLTYDLAIAEPLPDLPKPLPDKAPHLLSFLRSNSADQEFHSDIEPVLQEAVSNILIRHHKRLSANVINNLAVIIRETTTGKILVYHGNVPAEAQASEMHNDMVQTYRSSGSILKPFLFAAALQEGLIHPVSLLPDVPTWIAGFNPKNFDENYAGAVPAGQALQRSLNVPFVYLLKNYGVAKFQHLLHEIGFKGFRKTANHYGLSMILGGGEVTLFELTEVYARFAAHLGKQINDQSYPFHKSSICLTTDVLRALNRPETESGWTYHDNSLRMAWKTGTSFGFRDAWAVGYTPDYVIGVWAGNADGHGRPGLTGIAAAAPVLFDVASLLPEQKNWFDLPLNQLETVMVCSKSGLTPGEYCTEQKAVMSPARQLQEVQRCPYHQLIRTTEDTAFLLPPDCGQELKARMVNWFLLPPLMEYYYVRHNSSYQTLPPLKTGCRAERQWMDMVYPPQQSTIYQPVDYEGRLNPVVFEAIHRDQTAVIYWHLDNRYLGLTKEGRHQFIMPELAPGQHVLSLVDEHGNSVSRSFKLARK